MAKWKISYHIHLYIFFIKTCLNMIKKKPPNEKVHQDINFVGHVDRTL